MKNRIMNKISNPGIRVGIVFLTGVKSRSMRGGSLNHVSSVRSMPTFGRKDHGICPVIQES